MYPIPSYTDLSAVISAMKDAQQPTDILNLQWSNDDLSHSVRATLYPLENTITLTFERPEGIEEWTYANRQSEIYDLLKAVREFYAQEIKPYL